jgi:hypothetical protein
MAIFIVRAYNLPAASVDFFTDDNGKVYEDAADCLAQAGLTQGCAPNLYCGDDTITRGEMAAFLSRAENLPDSTTDHFVDDNSSIFEPGINKVADARITLGCNPPANTNFCPGDNVTRGQMAGFLTRALDLTPIIPPPRPTTTTTTTTQPPPNCDPSYPDFCIPPPPPDLDCGQVNGNNFTVLPPDPPRIRREPRRCWLLGVATRQCESDQDLKPQAGSTSRGGRACRALFVRLLGCDVGRQTVTRHNAETASHWGVLYRGSTRKSEPTRWSGIPNWNLSSA